MHLSVLLFQTSGAIEFTMGGRCFGNQFIQHCWISPYLMCRVMPLAASRALNSSITIKGRPVCMNDWGRPVWWEIMKCNFSLSQTQWMGLRPSQGHFAKQNVRKKIWKRRTWLHRVNYQVQNLYGLKLNYKSSFRYLQPTKYIKW
jgi:hypothetical protein